MNILEPIDGDGIAAPVDDHRGLEPVGRPDIRGVERQPESPVQ